MPPGKQKLNAQIFGLKNSQTTRAAERFFKERGVGIHFVDLKQKPMAPGEIRRFIERYTLQGLLEREGKPYSNANLQYLRVSDTELLERIERTPDLLKLPLVRCGNKISVGNDPEGWRDIAAHILEAK